MRIQVSIDSANTEQTRELLAALARIGRPQTATVGVNGPECWAATTPHLSPNEFAQVFAELVKVDGLTFKYATRPELV